MLDDCIQRSELNRRYFCCFQRNVMALWLLVVGSVGDAGYVRSCSTYWSHGIQWCVPSDTPLSSEESSLALGMSRKYLTQVCPERKAADGGKGSEAKGLDQRWQVSSREQEEEFQRKLWIQAGRKILTNIDQYVHLHIFLQHLPQLEVEPVQYRTQPSIKLSTFE